MEKGLHFLILAQTKAHKHRHRSTPDKLGSVSPPMGPVTEALNKAIELAKIVMDGTGGLQAQKQKRLYNKNARMHTPHTHTHTHTHTPQAELNHRSERDLRFSTNESTQARTPKQATQTRQCAAPHGSRSCQKSSRTYPHSLSLTDQTGGPRPPPAARSLARTHMADVCLRAGNAYSASSRWCPAGPPLSTCGSRGGVGRAA